MKILILTIFVKINSSHSYDSFSTKLFLIISRVTVLKKLLLGIFEKKNSLTCDQWEETFQYAQNATYYPSYIYDPFSTSFV